jgi:hypothetical protein
MTGYPAKLKEFDLLWGSEFLAVELIKIVVIPMRFPGELYPG